MELNPALYLFYSTFLILLEESLCLTSMWCLIIFTFIHFYSDFTVTCKYLNYVTRVYPFWKCWPGLKCLGFLSCWFLPLVATAGQLWLGGQFSEKRGQQPPAGSGWCYYSWLFWRELLCTCRRPRLRWELRSCPVCLCSAIFPAVPSFFVHFRADFARCVGGSICVWTLNASGFSCAAVLFLNADF